MVHTELVSLIILCVYTLQIRDDFLGRQILHFDFTNPQRRPPVVRTLAILVTSAIIILLQVRMQDSHTAIQNIGKSANLYLKDKYTNVLLDG